MILRRPAAVAVCTAGLLLATAAPALATSKTDDGEDPGSGLTVIQTLGWFVVLPVTLFVVIAILATLPSMSRGPRYRPGLGWWAAPIWFNGPDDADTAVRTAIATTGGGGASARW